MFDPLQHIYEYQLQECKKLIDLLESKVKSIQPSFRVKLELRRTSNENLPTSRKSK